MSDFLEKINFTNIFLSAFVLLLSIIAIRVKFDLNKFLENKEKRNLCKLINLCPHADIQEINNKETVVSAFISPAGTLQYQCQICTLVRDEIDSHNNRCVYWTKNPDDLKRKLKKYKKEMKKAGYA